MGVEQKENIGMTKEIAKFISSLHFSAIPDHVVSHVKLCLLDTIGCGIYGSKSATSDIVRKTLNRWPQTGSSRIWLDTKTTSAPSATLINASMASSMAFDDLHHLATVHAGVICVPAAVAAAEDVNSVSGRELITAIVAGYESIIRLALAVIPSARLRGFHPASICGGFGSAAATAKILGYGPDTTLQAIGIGGALCSGLMAAQHDSMVHGFQAASAASQGTTAAYLAGQGFKGVQTLLEEEYGGFCTSFADTSNLDTITDRLGEYFHAGDVGIKYYPVAGSVSSALDAVTEVINEHELNRSEITQIDIYVNKPVFLHSGFEYLPGSLVGAQMNIKYGVAALLTDGEVGVNQFHPGRLNSAEIKQHLNKLNVIHEPRFDNLDQDLAYQTFVVVKAANAKRYETLVRYPKGSKKNPLTKQQVINKFLNQVSTIIPPEVAEALISKIETLENISDINEISELLSAKSA